jgi:hypothetical protein
MTGSGEPTSAAGSVTTWMLPATPVDGLTSPSSPEVTASSKLASEPCRKVWPGWITWAATLLVLLPYLYDLVRDLADGGHGFMWGDGALEALDTRDVWRGHQMLGPYSRYGWHHPGPALFYLLALPDRLLGSNGPGIVAGVIVLNAVAAGAVVLLLGRRWGPWLAMWASGCLSLLHLVLGGALWRDLWNPYIVIMPMVLLVVLAADAATGTAASWCWALVVGTFAVQTHLSTAPAVVAIIAAGLGGLLWSKRTGNGFRVAIWPAAAALGVTALLWLPPLVDAVRHHPSNLSRMVTFFTAHHPVHGLGEAGRTSLSSAIVVFFGRHGPTTAVAVRSTATLATGAILIGLLTLVTVGIGLRRRDRLSLWLVLISAVGFAAAILGGTRVVGDINQYLTLWQAYLPITLLLGLGAALLAESHAGQPAAAAHLSRSSNPAPLFAFAPLAIALIGALTGAGLAAGQTAALAGPTQFPGYAPTAEVKQATDAVGAVLHPSDRVVRLTITTQSAWPTAAGVALELERGGRRTTEVATPGSGVDTGLLFGANRRPTGHEDVDIEFQRLGPGEVQGLPAHGAPLGQFGSLQVLVNRQVA